MIRKIKREAGLPAIYALRVLAQQLDTNDKKNEKAIKVIRDFIVGIALPGTMNNLEGLEAINDMLGDICDVSRFGQFTLARLHHLYFDSDCNPLSQDALDSLTSEEKECKAELKDWGGMEQAIAFLGTVSCVGNICWPYRLDSIDNPYDRLKREIRTKHSNKTLDLMRQMRQHVGMIHKEIGEAADAARLKHNETEETK